MARVRTTTHPPRCPDYWVMGPHRGVLRLACPVCGAPGIPQPGMVEAKHP